MHVWNTALLRWHLHTLKEERTSKASNNNTWCCQWQTLLLVTVTKVDYHVYKSLQSTNKVEFLHWPGMVPGMSLVHCLLLCPLFHPVWHSTGLEWLPKFKDPFCHGFPNCYTIYVVFNMDHLNLTSDLPKAVCHWPSKIWRHPWECIVGCQ